VIAVDTSALIAILLGEAGGARCAQVLADEEAVLISAGTLAEAMIVADRRNIGPELRRLVEDLAFEVAPVTPAAASRVAECYARWGRGIHAAGLNFGDCFAYALASERDAPLLYVGEDFKATDLTPA